VSGITHKTTVCGLFDDRSGQPTGARESAGRIANGLLRIDLVILDELGYLPFSPVGGALLFHLLSKHYEHTSVAITTKECLIKS